MTYSITVPVGTDRYSLASDLQTMAGEISTHLDSIFLTYAGSLKNGDSATFANLSSSSAPSFPTVNVTGSRPESKIANDVVNGFGLKSQNLYFTTKNGTTWTSTGPIVVPDGGTGTQAINRNSLDVEVSTLNAALSSLAARVSAIEAVYASQSYVDGKDVIITNSLNAAKADITSLSNAVATKANYYQNVGKVWDSQNAGSAGYATSAGSANYASGAGNASNADRFAGRALALGRQYYGSISGGSTGEATITHNLGYVPVVLANAYNDTGIMSIACSIGDINGSTAVIKFKNLNNSASESFSFNWMAI